MNNPTLKKHGTKFGILVSLIVVVYSCLWSCKYLMGKSFVSYKIMCSGTLNPWTLSVAYRDDLLFSFVICFTKFYVSFFITCNIFTLPFLYRLSITLDFFLFANELFYCGNAKIIIIITIIKIIN